MDYYVLLCSECSKSTPWPDKAINSLTLSPIRFYLTLWAPSTLASLLILKHARYTPTSGPLHILPFLPEAFFLQTAEWLTLPSSFLSPSSDVTFSGRPLLAHLFNIPKVPPLTAHLSFYWTPTT